uniref:Uncharacterized protein n=1 Tax=Salix viminalis TaxID=40686 RepID=A0A6N2KQL6_SALVM
MAMDPPLTRGVEDSHIRIPKNWSSLTLHEALPPSPQVEILKPSSAAATTLAVFLVIVGRVIFEKERGFKPSAANTEHQIKAERCSFLLSLCSNFPLSLHSLEDNCST